MKMWVGQMTEFCKMLDTKISPPRCDLECWAHNENIENELGLFTIDVAFEYFFIAIILSDTSITYCRPGSD